MSQAERAELQGRSGVSRQLPTAMEEAESHRDYCQFVAQDAEQHLAFLSRRREEMDLMVQRIEAEKEAKAKEAQAQKESESQQARGRDEEMEDQALLLMQTGSEIQLGRNLEQTWKDHQAAQQKEKGKKGKEDAKGSKASRDAPIKADAVEAAFDQIRGEGEAGEEQAEFSLQDVDPDQDGAGRRGKRGKKEKKKDKKGKKKDKKHKKRGRGEDDDLEGEESGAEPAEVPTARSNADDDLFDDGPAQPILPTADAGEPAEGESDEMEDRKDKKHKKDKKGKKDKKDKKAKKEAKRARLDKEDEEAEQELFGGEDGDRAMEEELFGEASD